MRSQLAAVMAIALSALTASAVTSATPQSPATVPSAKPNWSAFERRAINGLRYLQPIHLRTGVIGVSLPGERIWSEDVNRAMREDGHPLHPSTEGKDQRTIRVMPFEILHSFGGPEKGVNYIVQISRSFEANGKRPSYDDATFDVLGTPGTYFFGQYNVLSPGRDRIQPLIPIPESWVGEYTNARQFEKEHDGLLFPRKGAVDQDKLFDLMNGENPFLRILACRVLAEAGKLDAKRATQSLLEADGVVQGTMAVVMLTVGPPEALDSRIVVVRDAVDTAVNFRSIHGLARGVLLTLVFPPPGGPLEWSSGKILAQRILQRASEQPGVLTEDEQKTVVSIEKCVERINRRERGTP